MDRERTFENTKDWLTALALLSGASFLFLGSLFFAKYLVYTPPGDKTYNVTIDDGDTITETHEIKTDCRFSMRCGD